MNSITSKLFSRFSEIEHGFQWGNQAKPPHLLSAKQVHGKEIWEPGNLAIPQNEPSPEVCADAILLCSDSQRTLPTRAGVQTADCIPLLVYAKAGSAKTPSCIAAIHAGWRGLNLGILPTTLQKILNKSFLPEQVFIAVGPCIQQCCFEAAPEVVQAFEKNWATLWKGQTPPYAGKQPVVKQNARSQAPVGPNNLWVDLNQIALYQALAQGIPSANIESMGLCTYCGSENLQSFRRATHQNAKAGRQWSWIGFK